MISSFGESSLPVAFAGHASWQRPHSVHEKPSSTCFHVRSATVATPNRSSSSGRSKRSGSSRPRARVRPNQTLTAATPMCRCFEYGRYTRKPKTAQRCAQTKTRSAASPDGKTCDSAFERNDQLAGHSFSPAAISAACQQSSVRTTAAISAEDHVRLAAVRALEPSRPHHRADHDGGRRRPTSTRITKTSTSSMYQPW